MKHFIKYLFISFLFLSAACSKPKQTPADQLVFNGKNDTIRIDTTHSIRSKQLIANIKIIKLETSSSNLIGQIDKLLWIKDKIIVVDKRKAKTIFVFDETGHYLNSIGRIGRAPDEYIGIDDVSSIPGTDYVSVLDRGTKKVKIFDLNGKFIRAEETPLYLNSIEYFNQNQKIGSLIGRYPNDAKEYQGYSLFTFGKNWNIINYSFKDPFKASFKYTSTNTQKKYGNDIYYTPPFENIICQIDQNGIINNYLIDFLKNGIPEYQTFHSSDRDFQKLLMAYNYFDGIFCDVQNFMVLKIVQKQREATYFYNKTSKQVYFLNRFISTPLENYFHRADMQINDSVIVATISANQICYEKNWIRKYTEDIPEDTVTNQKIDYLLNNVTENDNPILFFYTVRTDEQ